MAAVVENGEKLPKISVPQLAEGKWYKLWKAQVTGVLKAWKCSEEFWRQIGIENQQELDESKFDPDALRKLNLKFKLKSKGRSSYQNVSDGNGINDNH